MQLLEAEGYVCTRAGASLGVWDVIGIGSRDVVLMQRHIGSRLPRHINVDYHPFPFRRKTKRDYPFHGYNASSWLSSGYWHFQSGQYC